MSDPTPLRQVDLDGGNLSHLDPVREALDKGDTVFDVNGEIVTVEHRYKSGFSVEKHRSLGHAAEYLMLYVIQDGQGRPLQPRLAAQYTSRINRYLTNKCNLPRLKAICEAPLLTTTDGRGFLTLPPIGRSGDFLFISESPNELVTKKFKHLKQAFSTSQFHTEADQLRLYGWVLGAFARLACDVFPFLVLTSSDKNVGKTRLARAVASLISFRDVPLMTFSGEEREMEKRLASLADQPCSAVALIDNINLRQQRGVRSQFLAAATTTAVVSLRGNYDKTNRKIAYPRVILTMNNASLERDLIDRAVSVRLEGDSNNYDVVDLEYVLEHRDKIVSEVILLLAGCLSLSMEPRRTRFGDFEDIATRACVRLFGKAPNFTPPSDADQSLNELLATVEAVVEGGNGIPAKKATLLSIAEHIWMYRDIYPEVFSALGKAHATSQTAKKNCIRKLLEDSNRNAGYERFTINEETQEVSERI